LVAHDDVFMNRAVFDDDRWQRILSSLVPTLQPLYVVLDTEPDVQRLVVGGVGPREDGHIEMIALRIDYVREQQRLALTLTQAALLDAKYRVELAVLVDRLVKSIELAALLELLDVVAKVAHSCNVRH